MYNRPFEGTKIKNNSTGEIYTVDQIVTNRETGQWDGLVRLDLTNPPRQFERDSLSFLDSNNYVRFDHETPRALPNRVSANSEGELINAPPLVPTVTWNIERTEPGGYGRPFDTRKEFKPRLRESVKDPLKPGYTVEIYGQSFDNVVQFDSWLNDPQSSERLYIWFEQFLKLYTWVFRKYGIQQMFFWQRLQDRTSTTWRQYYPVKTLQWYFRTETLEAVYQRDILNLDIRIDIVDEGDLPGLNEGTRWIADQAVSGKLTPKKYHDLFYRSGVYLFGDITINQST